MAKEIVIINNSFLESTLESMMRIVKELRKGKLPSYSNKHEVMDFLDGISDTAQEIKRLVIINEN